MSDVQPYTRETLPTRFQLRGWLKTGVLSVVELDALHATAEKGVYGSASEAPGLCTDCWEHLCSNCQERLAAPPAEAPSDDEVAEAREIREGTPNTPERIETIRRADEVYSRYVATGDEVDRVALLEAIQVLAEMDADPDTVASREEMIAAIRRAASRRSSRTAVHQDVFDAFENICPGAVDTERGRVEQGLPADVGYICRIVADVVRDREEQIEHLREDAKRKEELLGIVEHAERILREGAYGVPADSEAASHLHGVIDRALRAIPDGAIDAARSVTVPTGLPASSEETR